MEALHIAVGSPKAYKPVMASCDCRRDSADREGRAALRLAAAAAERQGRDLGHLP